MFKYESVKRSLAKALSYRILIMSLDFITIYFFTKRIQVAVGFMIISNLYTTISYIIHERIWTKIIWGINQDS